MISQLLVENYKSIQELEMELGRVTVLIGANGCGKSNILEAVALCSAAASNKLDHEFLASRGIRVPDNPHFMRSAFEAKHTEENITIAVSGLQDKETEADDTAEEKLFHCVLQNKDNSPYSVWSNISPIWNETATSQLTRAQGMLRLLQEIVQNNPERLKDNPDLSEKLASISVDVDEAKTSIDKLKQMKLRPSELQDFLIYSPENTSLRTFETERQIQPLGIKGEGLFKLLSVLSTEKNMERLAEIKKEMILLDWFDDFEVVPGASKGERNINIRDKYLDDKLSYFTQKSANEGFLFLLFYFTLFISRETPSFFAIDNIDASLNPKLCSRLLIELVELAKAHDKQAIVTTHNPAVLDGLDLNDDDQRLFVVSRNKLGHTKVKRVRKQESLPDQEPVRLSEAFLRGYLGGLPRNF